MWVHSTCDYDVRSHLAPQLSRLPDLRSPTASLPRGVVTGTGAVPIYLLHYSMVFATLQFPLGGRSRGQAGWYQSRQCVLRLSWPGRLQNETVEKMPSTSYGWACPALGLHPKLTIIKPCFLFLSFFLSPPSLKQFPNLVDSINPASSDFISLAALVSSSSSGFCD